MNSGSEVEPYRSAHSRGRPFHGKHGFDGDRHVAAGDCRRYRHISHRTQACPDGLSRLARHFHSDQCVDGRPLWSKVGLPIGHRRVRCGIDRLRILRLARRVRSGALPRRHGRRHDDARRAPGARQGDCKARSGIGHGVAHHACPDRTAGRSTSRRLHHNLLQLALDLPDQRAYRNYRNLAGRALSARHQADRRKVPRCRRLPAVRGGGIRRGFWPVRRQPASTAATRGPGHAGSWPCCRAALHPSCTPQA